MVARSLATLVSGKLPICIREVYAFEGTAAFEKGLHTLAPNQFQILAVHTSKGMVKVLLFSKEIIKAEARSFDTPQRRAKRAVRLRGLKPRAP